MSRKEIRVLGDLFGSILFWNIFPSPLGYDKWRTFELGFFGFSYFRILDFGIGFLDFQFWILDLGFCFLFLEFRFRSLDFWILDSGSWICFLFVTVVIVSGAAALPKGGVDLPKGEYVPTKTTITTKVGLGVCFFWFWSLDFWGSFEF